MIPALRRQRQGDLCEYEDSLVYRENSATVRATQRNLSQTQTNKQKNPETNKQTNKQKMLYLLKI